ncbi:helix-turn-helix domain-containing protein [Streptomyces sp. NPDC048420]|uniref:helix-turn-helix transcriptional regulator n=1 Tax=Streptomyces sp. NPDC048420 TaxID=3155755 RepID=UPI0034156921
MTEQAAGWGFLTNHARVLLAIARDSATRIRDLAVACHVTERTAQSIVTDLEQAGYLSRERDGRRTRYTLRLDGRLRHPAEAHLPITALLELFVGHDHVELTAPVSEGQDSTRGDPRQ